MRLVGLVLFLAVVVACNSSYALDAATEGADADVGDAARHDANRDDATLADDAARVPSDHGPPIDGSRAHPMHCGPSVTRAFAFDPDGDGLGDPTACAGMPGQLLAWSGPSPSWSGPPVVLRHPCVGPRAAGDVDDDGHDDVIDRVSAMAVWFGPDGSARADVALDASGRAFASVSAIGDMDGDGFADIGAVLVEADTCLVRIYYGDDIQPLAVTHDVATLPCPGGVGGVAGLAADAHEPCAAIAVAFVDYVALFDPGAPTDAWPLRTIDVPTDATGFGAWMIDGGDVDGDGGLDLIVVQNEPYGFHVVGRDGSVSALTRLPRYPLPGVDIRAGVQPIGDFDHDGRDDLVVNSGTWVLLAYGGTSPLEMPLVFEGDLIAGFVSAGAPGDVDGDGVPDVVMLQYDGVTVLFGGDRIAASSTSWGVHPGTKGAAQATQCSAERRSSVLRC